jgi:hypothetical protein
MVWFEGRDMHRCLACGYLFAYRWAGERYCSGADCQASKNRRQSRPRLKESRVTKRHGEWVGVRAAELEAKAALAELRAWMAQERAKW